MNVGVQPEALMDALEFIAVKLVHQYNRYGDGHPIASLQGNPASEASSSRSPTKTQGYRCAFGATVTLATVIVSIRIAEPQGQQWSSP